MQSSFCQETASLIQNQKIKHFPIFPEKSVCILSISRQTYVANTDQICGPTIRTNHYNISLPNL